MDISANIGKLGNISDNTETIKMKLSNGNGLLLLNLPMMQNREKSLCADIYFIQARAIVKFQHSQFCIMLRYNLKLLYVVRSNWEYGFASVNFNSRDLRDRLKL